MKLLLVLVAVSIGAANARSLDARILVDPNCSGLVGLTEQDVILTGLNVQEQKLKQVSEVVTPVETPSRWGLIPPKIENVKKEETTDEFLVKDVFGTDEKKDMEERRTTRPTTRRTTRVETTTTRKPTTRRTTTRRTTTRRFETTTKRFERLPERTEEETYGTDNDAYKPERTEDKPQGSDDGSYKPERTEDKPLGSDDGLYKAEKDNALVGKFDNGLYKPETPLFIYDQRPIPSTIQTLDAVRVESPFPQPSFVQEATVLQEPCLDETKIRTPIIVQGSGYQTFTPTVGVAPVLNVLRNDAVNFVPAPTYGAYVSGTPVRYDTDNGAYKPERFEEETQGSDDGSYKPERFEEQTQGSDDGSYKAERFEDKPQGCDDGTYKLERFEDKPQGSDDGTYKLETFEDKPQGSDDGSWKPERDNALLGRFDNGLYKPESPLFTYDQRPIPTTVLRNDAVNFVAGPTYGAYVSGTPQVVVPQEPFIPAVQNVVRSEPTPVRVETAERPYYFETASQVVQQPTFVRESTVVQEPCDDEVKIRAPIVVQESGYRAVEQVVVPQETIIPAVQNIVRSEPTPVTAVRFDTPTLAAETKPYYFETASQVVQQPTFVQESTVIREEPCDDDAKVRVETVVNPAIRFDVPQPQTVVRTETSDNFVIKTPTTFVRSEEVLRPLLQNNGRVDAFVPRPQFVLPNPYPVRSEEVIRPAVQNIVRNENVVVRAPVVPSVVRNVENVVLAGQAVPSYYQEPCDPVLENNFLIHK